MHKKIVQFLSLLFLAFVWGASFILMKRGMDVFSYIQVAAIRIFLSFIVLLPISIKNIKLITKSNAGILLISGLIGNFFPAFLFTLSETELSSSLAGTLNGLTPFFTLIVGVAAFKNKPSFLQYIGVGVGFIGAALLVTNGNFSSFGNINIFALFVVLATCMYGINANIIRFKLQGMNGIQITSLTFFFIGPIAGAIMLCTDLSTVFCSTDFMPSLLAIAALAVFGSVITLFVYYELIHYAGAIFASSATYIMPFFALMWGVLDGEKINSIHIYSLLVILLGVYLSSVRRKASFK